MHPDIKIQASCDKNQRIFGSSSTILHPLTWVSGQKNCSDGQEAKSFVRSSSTSQDKILNHGLEGEMHSVIKIQVSCNRNQSSSSLIILHLLT